MQNEVSIVGFSYSRSMSLKNTKGLLEAYTEIAPFSFKLAKNNIIWMIKKTNKRYDKDAEKLVKMLPIYLDNCQMPPPYLVGKERPLLRSSPCPLTVALNSSMPPAFSRLRLLLFRLLQNKSLVK